jgi:GDP-L-fucose synthase
VKLDLHSRIFVSGHRGMVGSGIVRLLKDLGYTNILCLSSRDLDLRDRPAVRKFFSNAGVDFAFLCAARVGGIQANIDHPAEFIHDNLAIQTNVIDESYRAGVKKLCFLGSSCIYPRECPQPIKEERLLTGVLEPTNEYYAIAKIAGLKMAQAYHKQYDFNCICPMPCNIYGANDSFDPNHSHVLSALVRKFVDAADAKAPEVTLWGSGVARREFLNVDDLARALLLLMEQWDSSEIINVGSGVDVSISQLAEIISQECGFVGTIVWDKSKPDGMLRKCMDVSKMNALGFKPKIELRLGISQMISHYRGFKGATTKGVLK